MMFQGTYFRSSKATTTTTTTVTNYPGDNKVASNQAARSGFSKSSPPLFQPTSLGRLIVGLTSIRLGSSPTSASVATTTSTSLGTHLKSLLLGCYYIIAFTSLLILILYLNRFASENLQQTRANARAGLMLSPTWPGVVAILSSAEMAAGALKSTQERIANRNHQDSTIVNINNSTSSNHEYLIRTKRSPTRDGKDSKNSSSISSQASHSTTTASQSAEPRQGKTSARRAEQRGRLLLKANPGNQVAGSSLPKQQQQQRQMANLDIELRDELDLASTLDLQRRTPIRTTSNQPLVAKQTPIAHSAPSTGAASAPIPMELTERQASYSVNNRGAINLANGSLVALSAQRSPKLQAGNWIPILTPQGRPASTNQATSTRAPQQARPATPSAGLVGEPSSIYRLTDHNLGPHELGSSSGRQYQTNAQPYNYHHDHPAHRHRPNRHWRRPRLNVPQPDRGAPRPAKMYKRVLLCDKTLVSLDYVKRGHYMPFEPHFELDGDDFDDNIIDLSSNLNQIYTSLDNINSVRRVANTTITLPGNSLQAADSVPDEAVLEVERRSYLNDEDPLVKCDMWDLEKGLKNRKPPREILQMAVKADFDSVRDAINRCRQLSERTLPPDDEYRDGIVEIMSTEDLISLFSMKRGLLPGTKWCGLGDMASSYNDLGPKHRIDICCRAHDHCPIRLKPFRNDYGVLNIGLYTKSHCDCDADFYRCLREAHSRTADMLGNLYFNVMKLQCMREERMKICREMKPIALGFERCVRYEESPVKTVFKFTTPPVAY